MSVVQATEYSSRVPFVQLGNATFTDFTTANLIMLTGYVSTTGSSATLRKAFVSSGYRPAVGKIFYARHLRVFVETTNFTSGAVVAYANSTDLGMNSAGGGSATHVNGQNNCGQLYIQNVVGMYETSLFLPFPSQLYVTLLMPTITVSGAVTFQMWGNEV